MKRRMEASAHVYRHVHKHAHRHARTTRQWRICTDMRVDMRVEMCMDMCIGMCIDIVLARTRPTLRIHTSTSTEFFFKSTRHRPAQSHAWHVPTSARSCFLCLDMCTDTCADVRVQLMHQARAHGTGWKARRRDGSNAAPPCLHRCQWTAWKAAEKGTPKGFLKLPPPFFF